MQLIQTSATGTGLALHVLPVLHPEHPSSSPNTPLSPHTGVAPTGTCPLGVPLTLPRPLSPPYRCGSNEHWPKECPPNTRQHTLPHQPPPSLSPPYRCGSNGHWSKECPRDTRRIGGGERDERGGGRGSYHERTERRGYGMGRYDPYPPPPPMPPTFARERVMRYRVMPKGISLLLYYHMNSTV